MPAPADSRRSKSISESELHDAWIGGCHDAAERRRRHAAARVSQIGMIEKVVSLRAELNAVSLPVRHGELLEHGHVHLLGPWTTQRVPAYVPERAEGVHEKWLGLEPLC